MRARATSRTDVYSEIAPNEMLVVWDEFAKWLRTRTKSRYEGIKINVPEPLPFPLPVIFFMREDRMAVVKYLNRASGSFAGERLSDREKVCLTGTGRGTSVMAPR